MKKILLASLILLVLVTSCAVISFYPIYTDDVLVRNDKIIGKWQSVIDLDFEKSFSNKVKGKNDTLKTDASIQTDDSEVLIWEISRKEKVKNKPNYKYKLHSYYLSDTNNVVEFDLHLIQLNGKTYIDFFPTFWDTENIILDFNTIGVHTFAELNVNADSVNIKWFDSSWFKKQLKADKIRIKHENNNKNILLTAKPKELQKFIIKYGNNSKAFAEGVEFTLKPIK